MALRWSGSDLPNGWPTPPCFTPADMLLVSLCGHTQLPGCLISSAGTSRPTCLLSHKAASKKTDPWSVVVIRLTPIAVPVPQWIIPERCLFSNRGDVQGKANCVTGCQPWLSSPGEGSFKRVPQAGLKIMWTSWWCCISLLRGLKHTMGDTSVAIFFPDLVLAHAFLLSTFVTSYMQNCWILFSPYSSTTVLQRLQQEGDNYTEIN